MWKKSRIIMVKYNWFMEYINFLMVLAKAWLTAIDVSVWESCFTNIYPSVVLGLEVVEDECLFALSLLPSLIAAHDGARSEQVRLFQNKPPPLELVMVVQPALGSLVQHKICHFSNNFLNLFNTGTTLLRSSSGGFPNLSCNCVIYWENTFN